MLVAGEIFAESFADDGEIRGQVVEHLLRAPSGIADAVLADLLLHPPDAHLEATLRERTKDRLYDVATHFKLVAALSSPPKVIESLYDVLSRNLSDFAQFHFPRWVPAVLKRIEKDSAVQDGLYSALGSKEDPSVKASFVLLLARARRGRREAAAFATDELQRTASQAVPQVGFDLVSQAYRLVRQVLLEIVC